MTLNETTTKITDGGRIVIPSLFRKELGLNIGDEVVVILFEGEIRILTRSAAAKRASDMVKRYSHRRNLTEELIKERRFEANE